MQYSYIKKWAKFLNIGYDNCFSYTFKDVQIKFRTNEFSIGRNNLGKFSTKEYVLVLDIGSGEEITRFNHHFIFQVYNKFYNKSDDIYLRVLEGEYSEKLIVSLLIKIISLYPALIDEYREQLRVRKELKKYTSGKVINLSDLKVEDFPVHKFKVYKLYWKTERCVNRVGKDNKFFIKESTDWLVKFDDTIIDSFYLKSLLPKKEIKEWSMYAYSAITEYSKSLDYMENETEAFISKFNASEFIKSINNPEYAKNLN
jgi:hypothetical protein